MNSDTSPRKDRSVRERILSQIENNELQMRSRASFAFQLAGLAVLLAIILLISVFIGTILFFTLRINGHEGLLSLGTRGISIFIQVFPWWLLGVDILLIIGLAWLIRYFRFGYQRPAVYVFLSLVALALLGGFALDTGTPLNDRLLQDSDRGGLPQPLRSLYQGTRRPPPRGSAYRGTITSIGSGFVILHDPDLSHDVKVLLPNEGRAARETFTIGETVFVIGDQKGEAVQAFDIHPFNPEGIPPELREGAR